MTKEHLNEIMASLCKKLMIDKSDLVAISLWNSLTHTRITTEICYSPPTVGEQVE